MIGLSALAAPIKSAGVDLSQPPMRHGSVEGVGAQYLLGVHREQVPVQHRRRLLEGLRERGHGHLDGVPAGLPDASLDRLGTLAQVHMAGIDVAPGVEYPDEGLAGELLGTDAELAGTRAVAEGA